MKACWFVEATAYTKASGQQCCGTVPVTEFEVTWQSHNGIQGVRGQSDDVGSTEPVLLHCVLLQKELASGVFELVSGTLPAKLAAPFSASRPAAMGAPRA